MRKSVIILIVLAAVILASIYFFQTTDSLKSEDILEEQTMDSSVTDDEEQEEVSDSEIAATSVTSESGAPVGLQSLNEQQLKKWISEESRSMNSTGLNTEEIQLRLKAQAQTLTTEQLKALVKVTRESSMPANERVLAAYMLSLNTSANSLEAMFEVSAQPITDHGPSIPHSEAELRNAQELALRYMQVDELAQRAKTNPNAKDKLKLLSQKAESQQVRSYAERLLKELR
ncbi:hypothetical protein [Pseudobdellovibrio exovorus]|uniref:Uncharacterized protein n=1 Tax=Pseudobdellovibrio exovorus JSS TaxID=1184267 RepID=M4VBP7_9BACT|nr:hypothetical protein [Pseudobdellovibrio exovorus]AGH95910.1 hypothetical protein A11Q_1694 [Pseudobdellovibrio exovorus JSS]